MIFTQMCVYATLNWMSGRKLMDRWMVAYVGSFLIKKDFFLLKSYRDMRLCF